MTYPALYRRRLIPDECILLKDDIVLEWNEDRIVTSWKALHPKKDLHHGSSCYFLNVLLITKLALLISIIFQFEYINIEHVKM